MSSKPDTKAYVAYLEGEAAEYRVKASKHGLRTLQHKAYINQAIGLERAIWVLKNCTHSDDLEIRT